jgi:hypothetical protein
MNHVFTLDYYTHIDYQIDMHPPSTGDSRTAISSVNPYLSLEHSSSKAATLRKAQNLMLNPHIVNSLMGKDSLVLETCELLSQS